LNVSGFNLAWCDAFEFEGVVYKLYYTFLGVIAMMWIGYLLVSRYRTATPEFKRQILLMGVGIEFFLFSFFTILYLATQLATWAIVEDSRLEMYGLFGMTVFMVFIGILIVRFKTFNVGLLASNALVIALVVLTASQFTFITSTPNIVLTSISLVLIGIIGLVLIRSVRMEIRQRKQIEQLAKNLEKANQRLKVLDKMKSEFVSIASHQLRSPLTAIRGYTSMLIEGSYGKLSKKASEAVERIQDSSRFMALSVEDYLNVSRIEAGNMKYEIADFNLKEVAEKVVDELRPAALKKGLLLIFRSDCDGSCSVHADIGKVRQVIMNLVDNAMKYTPKGGITVIAHDDVKKKKMYVTIKDTGVGMSKDTIDEVFEKFVRAQNANRVNVTGTGLGLFVAKKMMDEMGGRIWGESEGEGEGSSFHIELPLLPGKYRP
jgi:signal transduction histidine kinase